MDAEYLPVSDMEVSARSSQESAEEQTREKGSFTNG